MLSIVCLSISLIVIAITALLLKTCRDRLKRKQNNRLVSLMAVLGSGGHTSEMMALLSGMKLGSVNGKYSPITFVVSKGDHLSVQKVKPLMQSLTDCQLFEITRSRSVGQSYWTSIYTTLMSLIESLRVLYRVRPDLIVCNGPAICFAICLSAKLISKLMFSSVEIVFVESFCRTETLSLTAKLLYYSHICDHFLVQWPELTVRYKRAKYIGLLV